MTDFPRRKRIRLTGFDYSRNGAYFVTVCLKDRRAILWDVGADSIRPQEPPLSQYGKIVSCAINAIAQHYHNVAVDKYCIMPNHIYILLFLLPDESGRMVSAPTRSGIIGSMKRWVSKQIGFSIWQKSFHDHIIRNEQEYQEIWQYIDENPLKWKQDCFYCA